MASRQLLITRIAGAGTSFGPLPCQALHSYKVTGVHRMDVEVGADGPTSAPTPGPAPLRRRRAPSGTHLIYPSLSRDGNATQYWGVEL
jgi:hypothetical protein